MYVFKHIVLSVNREVLASQRKKQSLKNGRMCEDLIKDNEELVEIEQWDIAFQLGGTMNQCSGVRAGVIQEMAKTRDRYVVGIWKMRLE